MSHKDWRLQHAALDEYRTARASALRSREQADQCEVVAMNAARQLAKVTGLPLDGILSDPIETTIAHVKGETREAA